MDMPLPGGYALMDMLPWIYSCGYAPSNYGYAPARIRSHGYAPSNCGYSLPCGYALMDMFLPNVDMLLPGPHMVDMLLPTVDMLPPATNMLLSTTVDTSLVTEGYAR